LVFWAWMTSLRMMFSSSIHLPTNGKISFFYMADWNSIVYKYHIFLIHSSIVGHLGCFHNLAIANSALHPFLLSLPSTAFYASLCLDMLPSRCHYFPSWLSSHSSAILPGWCSCSLHCISVLKLYSVYFFYSISEKS
jgi:hypothetical protein